MPAPINLEPVKGRPAIDVIEEAVLRHSRLKKPLNVKARAAIEAALDDWNVGSVAEMLQFDVPEWRSKLQLKEMVVESLSALLVEKGVMEKPVPPPPHTNHQGGGQGSGRHSTYGNTI